MPYYTIVIAYNATQVMLSRVRSLDRAILWYNDDAVRALQAIDERRKWICIKLYHRDIT